MPLPTQEMGLVGTILWKAIWQFWTDLFYNIFRTEVRYQGNSDPEIHVALHDPKMYPHPNFWIPTLNNEGGIIQTRFC